MGWQLFGSKSLIITTMELFWVTARNTYDGSGSTLVLNLQQVILVIGYRLNVGTNVILTSYELYPRTSTTTGQPVNMNSLSTDGTTWTQVKDWSGLTVDDDWKTSGLGGL